MYNKNFIQKLRNSKIPKVRKTDREYYKYIEKVGFYKTKDPIFNVLTSKSNIIKVQNILQDILKMYHNIEIGYQNDADIEDELVHQYNFHISIIGKISAQKSGQYIKRLMMGDTLVNPASTYVEKPQKDTKGFIEKINSLSVNELVKTVVTRVDMKKKYKKQKNMKYSDIVNKVLMYKGVVPVKKTISFKSVRHVPRVTSKLDYLKLMNIKNKYNI